MQRDNEFLARVAYKLPKQDGIEAGTQNSYLHKIFGTFCDYYEILHSLIIGKAKILFGLHDGTDQIWLASNEHDVQTSDWGTSAGVITGDDLGE